MSHRVVSYLDPPPSSEVGGDGSLAWRTASAGPSAITRPTQHHDPVEMPSTSPMSWSINSVDWPRSASSRRVRPSSSLRRRRGRRRAVEERGAHVEGPATPTSLRVPPAVDRHRVRRRGEIDEAERVFGRATRRDGDVSPTSRSSNRSVFSPRPGQPPTRALVGRQRADVLALEFDAPGEPDEASDSVDQRGLRRRRSVRSGRPAHPGRPRGRRSGSATDTEGDGQVPNH